MECTHFKNANGHDNRHSESPARTQSRLRERICETGMFGSTMLTQIDNPAVKRPFRPERYSLSDFCTSMMAAEPT